MEATAVYAGVPKRSEEPFSKVLSRRRHRLIQFSDFLWERFGALPNFNQYKDGSYLLVGLNPFKKLGKIHIINLLKRN